eukprot:6050902-Prymnesium_polylepis.1
MPGRAHERWRDAASDKADDVLMAAVTQALCLGKEHGRKLRARRAGGGGGGGAWVWVRGAAWARQGMG